jgi:hypothetical protein
MTPAIFYQSIVKPTMAGFLAPLAPTIRDVPESRVLLMTIAGIESDWSARRQIGGPARSFWQFEQGGGVAELLGINYVAPILRATCSQLAIPSDSATIFEAMAWNDSLACTMARLLLWQDPMPLPDTGDTTNSYAYYLRNWRPGAPQGITVWQARYASSMTAMA